jgi:hypothetical protein
MARENDKWGKASLSTKSIQLDPQNPRIDAFPTASQETIRSLLLQTEKVVELANSIVRSGALFAGERIIVLREGSKHIVLEGNRRVCACQILLEPALAPPTYRKRLLPTSRELRQRIAKMEADVAPSREAAEVIITRRHTQPGIEAWTPIAKQRRIARMIESGSTIEEVMDRFQMAKSSVTRIVRDYEILRQVKSLNVWTPEEQKKLENPLLKTNPFTRFFTLKGAKQTLGISFDEKGRLVSSLDKPQLSSAMERLARELLLPSDLTESRLNTRATPEEVFDKAFRGDKELQRLVKRAGKQRKTNGQLSAKADNFFESLRCPIQDDQLILLTNEISSIDYKKFKTAATFLLRALLERTLDWTIHKYRLTSQLMKEYHSNYKGPQREPGLDFKIRFCIKQHDTIFMGNVKRNLEHWLHIKDFNDLVVHGKWAQANVHSLEQAASTVRPFIKNIFDGTALKP